MKHHLLGYCLLTLLASPPSYSSSPSWTREALRLTGESEVVRAESLRRLRKIPRLENLLKKELRGSHQALALDTIAALKMTSFVSELLRLAQKDPHGFIYLTLNTLLTPQNQERISKIYTRRLFHPPTPQAIGPSQVVLIETLGLLGHKLPLENLKTLFQTTPWPEVQGAILTYARIAVLQDQRAEYKALIPLALSAKSRQVRVQARYLLKDFKKMRKP